MWPSPLLVSAALFFIGVGVPGCGTRCDRRLDEDPVRYTDGRTRDGVYETAPPAGPYLVFPPGRTYRLVHDLGGEPRIALAWLAFEARPLDGEPASGTIAAAGDQVTFEALTDDHVDVRNDTCSDVFLRVVASEPLFAEPNDAGTDGGS
jgi:hypothetical protein